MISVADILKLLFTKFVEVEQVHAFFNAIVKIPGYLKVGVLIAACVGFIYFTYTKFQSSELVALQEEVTLLRDAISEQVKFDEYLDDMFYIVEALQMNEQISEYAYKEEQLQLELIEKYIKKTNPTDPILYDIDAMKERNEYNYIHYSKQFQKIIEKCKKQETKSERNEKENK